MGRREWEIEDQIVAHLAELGYPKRSIGSAGPNSVVAGPAQLIC